MNAAPFRSAVEAPMSKAALEKLRQALRKIDRPGTFCASGSVPAILPGLEVDVRHEGQERAVDFQGPADDPFRIHFAAFYADCEHEVRPLAKGYRLCLVYNLTLARAKKPVRAPRSGEHVEAVARLLRAWAA